MSAEAQSSAAAETISAALTRGRSRLDACSDTARLDAELLLMKVLSQDRIYLRARPEQPLTEDQAARYDELLRQRTEGQPIAYLTGEREFWSRTFKIRPGVLIPRPDTELLVEIALERLSGADGERVLDLGTGSGIIAITLACEHPRTQVIATDFSETALAQARENADRLGATKLELFLGTWFSALDDCSPFDLIVSNPPYIAEADEHLGQGDLRFEPRMALAAGPAGLDAIAAIARDAPAFLKSGGTLLLEHGYDQGEVVANLLTGLGYQEVLLYRDLQNHPRVTAASRP